MFLFPKALVFAKGFELLKVPKPGFNETQEHRGTCEPNSIQNFRATKSGCVVNCKSLVNFKYIGVFSFCHQSQISVYVGFKNHERN